MKSVNDIAFFVHVFDTLPAEYGMVGIVQYLFRNENSVEVYDTISQLAPRSMYVA